MARALGLCRSHVIDVGERDGPVEQRHERSIMTNENQGRAGLLTAFEQQFEKRWR
jgi:hypothetical protein